jgi:hypothetical protein
MNAARRWVWERDRVRGRALDLDLDLDLDRGGATDVDLDVDPELELGRIRAGVDDRRGDFEGAGDRLATVAFFMDPIQSPAGPYLYVGRPLHIHCTPKISLSGCTFIHLGS